MPRCRFQPDQWGKWIQDHSVSNLSAADFCANHQLPVHSFYFWRRKLASHSKPKKRKNLADAKLAENALQFIPLATSGLLAQVVVSKFGDHLPGYRQEDIFSRHGMEMRRCTLYDWMSGVADLCLPLYQRMQQRVLESFSIHTDDTTVKLVDKHLRSTKPARFWCYQGDAEHPYAVYDFTLDRAREGPAKFLKSYQGYLQADAYSGYGGIYLNSGDAIQEVACWAHCRRYWYKAREVDPARTH